MLSLLAQWNMTFLDYSDSFIIFKLLKWGQDLVNRSDFFLISNRGCTTRGND